MPGGRPPLLAKKITVGDEKLTVHDAIVELVRQGRSPTIASRLYGIPAEEVWRWIRRGRLAQARYDEGKHVEPAEQRYRRFCQDLDRSWAEYVRDYEDLLDQLARGGLVLGTVVETIDPNVIDPRTDRPQVLERKVTTSRSLPDIRAIRLVLERKARAEGWSAQPVPELEEPEDDDREQREAELLSAIQAYKEGLEDGATVNARRVIDTTASEYRAELPEGAVPGG